MSKKDYSNKEKLKYYEKRKDNQSLSKGKRRFANMRFQQLSGTWKKNDKKSPKPFNKKKNVKRKSEYRKEQERNNRINSKISKLQRKINSTNDIKEKTRLRREIYYLNPKHATAKTLVTSIMKAEGLDNKPHRDKIMDSLMYRVATELNIHQVRNSNWSRHEKTKRLYDVVGDLVYEMNTGNHNYNDLKGYRSEVFAEMFKLNPGWKSIPKYDEYLEKQKKQESLRKKGIKNVEYKGFTRSSGTDEKIFKLTKEQREMNHIIDNKVGNKTAIKKAKNRLSEIIDEKNKLYNKPKNVKLFRNNDMTGRKHGRMTESETDEYVRKEKERLMITGGF